MSKSSKNSPSATAMVKTRFPGIYRRANGKYIARIRSNGCNLSETFSNLDNARQWHRDTLSDIEAKRKVVVDGKVVAAEEAERTAKRNAGRTLSDLIDKFEKTTDCKIPEAHRRYFDDKLGDELVDELTAAQIREVIDEKTATLAPATFNRYKAAISRILNYALELGWIDRNVVAGKALQPKKEDNRRDRVITPGEEKALLAACEEADPAGRLATAFALAMATGARRGELMGLTWRQVDLKRGTCRLMHGTTKNKEARTLVVRGYALERLKEYAKVQPMNKDELVFQSDSGSVYEVTKAFRKVADELGMPDVLLHSCRHTFATRMARVPGMTLVMLRDALGHKSLAMVQRYAHEMTDDLGSFIEKMQEMQS